MPKVVISSDKGLVQKSGTTVLHQVTNKNSNDATFGKYTYVREIDFGSGGASGGAYTATNTAEGLVARLCSVANPTVILNASIQITEEFAGGLASTGAVTVTSAADTDVTSGAAVSSGTDVIASTSLAGAAGSAIGVAQAAGGTTITSKTELAIINDGTSNTTGACTAGKVLFIMEVLSSEAPVDLAQKF